MKILTRISFPILAIVIFCLVSENFLVAAENDSTNYLNETPAQKAARMKWWNDGRFGMFIHWGVYSVPAGEWDNQTGFAEWILEQTHMPVSQYEKFADQFNPTNFNAKAWVAAAKNAGVKYIVITSKHHDGFAMYPTKLSDWSISRTPFKRDPLKELADACHKAGIKFCVYYTIMDWHSSDWGTRRPWNDVAAKSGPPNMDRFEDYMKSQLKELITNYGPLGLIWFDGNWESPWTAKRGREIYDYVRSLQPSLIVNNRVGKPESTPGGGFAKTGEVGDYGTPEQTIPPTGFGPGIYWESCMTMNDHWGYNKADQNFKSAETLVHNLIDCASKGGNYLLNVGPTSAGVIPAPELERLKEIGDWMRVNGVAIYDTSASPFKKLPWGRCTQKADGKNTILYLHVWNWPNDGKLLVPGLKNSVKSATLLATGEKLKTSANADGVVIEVPATAPDSISSTIVLKIKGAPEVEATVLKQNADGSINLHAADADLHGGLQYEVGNGKDNIGYWTDPNDSASWTFKANQPGKFQVIVETAAQAESHFEILIGDQNISGTAPNTGDYTKFQNTKLNDTLVISTPGEITLAVKPVKENWSPINLKSVTLTPISN
ncbi:MAG TPA: alpha-L-fucosidase [Verrucomicrobiae bacterium]|nr:alpha-L-fucosidase [Verrucomicrobiae bacterium]